MSKIILASDHGGFELKQEVIEYLDTNNLLYEDVGCYNIESCDYPDYAHKAVEQIDDTTLGIFICGSGNGINMAANKHSHIRSALCWNEDITSLARKHNNANVICLPGRFISTVNAINCVKTFLNTKFEGGRHLTRINKI